MNNNIKLVEFLQNLNNIKTFKGKIDLVNQNLEKIGAGSGRIVYNIDDKSVLKLAKNPKGIAQNEVESSIGNDYYAKHIVANVVDSANDDSWLISEKAKKVGEKRIKQLTGIPSLNDLFFFLKNIDNQNKGGGKIFTQSKELEDFFWKNEFSRDIIDFATNYNQISRDLGKVSSYGEVLRDNQPTIVLVDYGLSDEVYSSHYSPQRNKNYPLYELYNFEDGNDDILSDINSKENIKQGIWTLIPQGVEDSGDKSLYVDENFINFIIKTNKYPKKPITNLPTLTDKFQECVNHIREYINLSEDKKLFYENLLILQEYLIENHYYDRDKLLKEDYEINEIDNDTQIDIQQIPKVKKWSISDQNRITELAKELSQRLNLSEPKFLGGGSLGFAFEINPNLILKITSDPSEADSALKLMKANPKHLTKTSNVYKIYDDKNELSYFALLQENIQNKPISDFRRFYKIFNIISPTHINYDRGFIDLITERTPNFDELYQIVNSLLTDNNNVNVSENARKEAHNFFKQLIEIKKELTDLGIKSNDFTNPENLGYKDNILKYYDIGGYRTEEPQIPDSSVIILPENDNNEYNDIRIRTERLKYVFDNIIEYEFNKILNYYLGKIKEIEPEVLNKVLNYFKKNPKDYNSFKKIIIFIKNKISDDGLNERLISSMKGSSIVNVKKKCRLGGQGNTSAKCNQGDINNLEIKRIDEIGEITSQPFTFKLKDNTKKYKTYLFYTGDNDIYLCVFTNMSENQWKMDFGLRKVGEKGINLDASTVVNKGKLFRIMSTIVGIFNDFTNKFKPDLIKFKAKSESDIAQWQKEKRPQFKGFEGEDVRRKNLYLTFLKKGLPSNYEITDTSDWVIIEKKDKTKKHSNIKNIVRSTISSFFENLDIEFLDETSVKSVEKEEIYRDNNYIVVRPLTHNAARKYGCDTNWCTSTSNTKHFDSHTKDDNFLIYIINKNIKPAPQQIRNKKINKFSDLYNSGEWDNIDDEEKEKYLDFSRIAISVEYENDGYPDIRIFDANDFDLYDFTGNYGDINGLPIPQNVKNAVDNYLSNNLKYQDKNNTNEGVGDKYAEKEFNVEPEFHEFEKQYNKLQNIENKEEFISGKYKGESFQLIKNPKTLKNIGFGVRGLIDKEGNLYLEQNSLNIHDNIVFFLVKKGLINYQPRWAFTIPKEFITVVRMGLTNTIAIGESNEQITPENERKNDAFWNTVDNYNDSKLAFQMFFDKAKQKNPNINFINQKIDYKNTNKNIISEQQKPISKEYINKLWNWLKPNQRNNKLHKNWYNKAMNNTLTDKEKEHFMFLLKNGDSMYNRNKLTTKN